MWDSQVVPQLRGNAVLGFVNGTILHPLLIQTSLDVSPTLNLEYVAWHHQDQLLKWLITSLYEVHAQVIGLSISHEV